MRRGSAFACLIAPLLALASAQALVRSAQAQPLPQYEIALSAVTLDPPAPAAGDRAMLIVTVRSRALTPASRAETVGLRVVVTRAAQGDAPEAVIGARVGSLRLEDAITIAVPWLAAPGTHE